jgi:hypothetical protein
VFFPFWQLRLKNLIMVSEILVMFRRGIAFAAANTLLLGSVWILSPAVAVAQRHGGGGTPGAVGGGLSGISRPSGLDEKDSLKDFHHALAVQATSQQETEYAALLKKTVTAKNDLQLLTQQLSKGSPIAELVRSEMALSEAVEIARNANKKFTAGLSDAQKTGLKDLLKRIEKTDSDLAQEQKSLDLSFADAKVVAPDASARAAALDKLLADFYDQQLGMGVEMSIVSSDGGQLTYILPAVKNAMSASTPAIAVSTSGKLSETAADSAQRTYRLLLNADLSDLQLNVTEFMRSQLDRSESCGQRVDIRQASLVPSSPSSFLTLKLHFERWTCARQTTPSELAESDGTVYVKLTPVVGDSHVLKLVPEFTRIEASGILQDSLQNGFLGDELREKVAQSVLSVISTGIDFKTTLPLAAQNGAVIQAAKFMGAGSGNLSIALEGQIQLSAEQATALASQLKQPLAAQEAPPK